MGISIRELAETKREANTLRRAAEVDHAEERSKWMSALAKYEAEATQMMISVEHARSEAKASASETEGEISVLRAELATRIKNEQAVAELAAGIAENYSVATKVADEHSQRIKALQHRLCETNSHFEVTDHLEAEQEMLAANAQQLEMLAAKQQRKLADLEEQGEQKHKDVLSAFEALIKARANTDSEEEREENHGRTRAGI